MDSLLNAENLVVVGIGLDIAAGYLLARGLVVSAAEISARNSSLPAAQAASAVAQASDRADAQAGLVILLTGFTAQLVGLLLQNGGEGRPGFNVAVALGLGVAAGALALATTLLTRNRRIKKLLVKVASVDPVSRVHFRDGPDLDRLAAFGVALGERLQVAPQHELPAAYAARVFGIRTSSSRHVKLLDWDPPSQGKALLVATDQRERLHRWATDYAGHPFHAEAQQTLAIDPDDVVAYFDIDYPDRLRVVLPATDDDERAAVVRRAIALEPRLKPSADSPWDFEDWDDSDDVDGENDDDRS